MNESNDNQLVAVYGTLKSGYGNHVLLSRSIHLGDDLLRDISVTSGFPFAVKREGGQIFVEVYQVDNRTLARLDALEGHPNFYRRELVSTVYGEAWLYFLSDPSSLHRQRNNKFVADGVWTGL